MLMQSCNNNNHGEIALKPTGQFYVNA